MPWRFNASFWSVPLAPDFFILFLICIFFSPVSKFSDLLLCGYVSLCYKNIVMHSLQDSKRDHSDEYSQSHL